MLYFCEDCGEKNFLEPDIENDGTISFRCRACNYLNKLRVSDSSEEEQPPDPQPPPTTEEK